MIDLGAIAENDKWLGFIQRHNVRRMAKRGKAAGRVLDSYGVAWKVHPRGRLRVVLDDVEAVVCDYGPLSFWGIDQTIAGSLLPNKLGGDSAVCFTAAVIEASVALVKVLRKKYADAEAALVSA